MKPIFVNFTLALVMMVVALTSCSRNYHVEYSGRYHPDTKIDKSSAADISKLPQSSEISKLPVVNTDETYMASINEEDAVAAIQVIKNTGKNYKNSISQFDGSTAIPVERKAQKTAAKTSAWKELADQSSARNKIHKELNHSFPNNDKLLYCLLAIFLPPLAVALWEDDITINFWLDILFTLLFWIPGVIFAWVIII